MTSSFRKHGTTPNIIIKGLTIIPMGAIYITTIYILPQVFLTLQSAIYEIITRISLKFLEFVEG